MNLNISDLTFGKTDAFNELKEFGPKWFVRAFFPYEKYEIDSFINGNSYYICGEKGTGKTALLRFLQCRLSDDPNNVIIPIRFKTEFDVEDKKAMINIASNIKETTAEGVDDFRDDTDTVSVWQIYIINQLLEKCADSNAEYQVFEESMELSQLRQLLRILYPDHRNKIVPKLKRGQLSVSANIMKVVDAQLQIEIGFEGSTSSISFNRVVKSTIAKFQRLKFLNNKVYILFDELELSVKSPKEHKRDIQLVRDLIIAIDRMNEICKLSGYDIHTIASIRTEVIHSVHAAGYEINKSIEDYGVILSWYQKGGDYRDNKLLKLVENKIVATEEERGIMDHGDIWERYFPETINGIETKKYILNYSWLHPRDIVRLMNEVVRQSNLETKFTQEAFDRAMRSYSKKSWSEIAEGLILKYHNEDLETIKLILTNCEVPFTYAYLMQRIRSLSEIYPDIEKFYQKNNLRNVLIDLFEFGVIGNTGQRMVFKFMEDDDLAMTEDMIIHKPLRNFFCVKSRSKTRVDLFED